MLIIEDREELGSQSSKTISPGLIERAFYKLHEAFVDFSTSHPQLVLFCIFIEHLQVTAIVISSLVIFMVYMKYRAQIYLKTRFYSRG